MDTSRIAELLAPFLPAPATRLGQPLLQDILIYINILIKWNARLNLTAVREPERIVTRHFGESLFAAAHLFPDGDARASVVDVGSGAGFPGIPIRLWAPNLKLTLIESHQKKAVFLREVCRALQLTNAEVFADRAQNFPPGQAEVVTLRAVEKFESALPAAARLLAATGRLAVLVGNSQIGRARELLPEVLWSAPTPIPKSEQRVLLVGTRHEPA